MTGRENAAKNNVENIDSIFTVYKEIHFPPMKGE